MRPVVVAVSVGCALAMVASCGGSAFSVSPGGDDGGGGDAIGADVTTGDVNGPDANGSDSSGSDGFVLPDVLEAAPPTCGGQYGCVPAVPAGWAGPLELYAGSGLPPPCSAQFQVLQDAFDHLDAPQPTCGCACGSPKVLCGSLPISFYGVAACVGTTSCSSIILSPGSCTVVDERTKCAPDPSGVFMSASQAGVTSASCAAQPTRTVPPPTWGTNARACLSSVAPAQVDCPSGSVCAPKPAAPYGSSACIAMQGDVACPPGPYTSRRAFFGGVDDSRDCTACTCGSPANASCAGTVSVYSSANLSCTGGAITYQAPFSCAPINQPADFDISLTAGGGACTPSSSTPTGTATPSKAFTVCCLP